MPAPFVAADQTPHYTPCATMPSWTLAMREATRAHRSGWEGVALAHYNMALAWARVGMLALEDAPQPCATMQADDVLHAWVSTLACLAALQAEAGQVECAAQNLAQAHKRVLTWLQLFPLRDARHACAVWHSRQSHAALLSHWAEHGPQACLEDALHAGCLNLMAWPHQATGAALAGNAQSAHVAANLH